MHLFVQYVHSPAASFVSNHWAGILASQLEHCHVCGSAVHVLNALNCCITLWSDVLHSLVAACSIGSRRPAALVQTQVSGEHVMM